MSNTNSYNTVLFTDVFYSADDFLDSWKNSGLYESGLVSDANIKKTYYLLLAKHCNSPIVNVDVNQFILKVHDIIFRVGPTWQKKLSVQASLRALTDAELVAGAKMIHNHAYNPGDAPSTDTTAEIDFINEQSVDKNQRSIIDGYNLLLSLLEDDVTSSYIKQFAKLFKVVVAPERTILFGSEEEE